MKVSIVVAVLNSHEVVRRQILHFKKMDLPDDVEIIFVDDGSEPPLAFPDCGLEALTISATGNMEKWTQPAARNHGARMAKGEFLLLTDIDHILSRELIEAVRTCPNDVLRFRREAGVLDEHGNFTQDVDVLLSYGLLPERIPTRGVKLLPHSNSFAIKRAVFWGIGGMPEKHRRANRYPNREELPVKQAIKKLVADGKITIGDDAARPTIYMIPNGRFCGDADYNPFGLFHSLSRKQSDDNTTSRPGSNVTLEHYRKKLQSKAKALNCARPLPSYLKPMVGGKTQVAVADLGAGPFSLVGMTHGDVVVQVIASDLLADEFNGMLDEAQIVPVVPVEKQDMERLTYADDSFDIVHCVNALDHTIDPRQALLEMYRVCKPGGGIYLRHFQNVGEHRKYDGLHRWNILHSQGDCKIWNQHTSFLLSDLFPFACVTEFKQELPYEQKEMVVSQVRK